jgi:glutamate 5-kinase
MQDARQAVARAQRVVVKVGTAVVARAAGGVALGRLGQLVETIAALRAEGREVVLVSSGAVGLGVDRLGLDRRPTGVVDLQACAAVGQGMLMGLYDGFFARVGLVAAQVLLTEHDFHERARCVSLAATLERLLALGAVPILNENDVVSAAQLSIFGDNDRLAALVASHLDGEALVLLSDVDGLYTAPPGTPGAERVAVYDNRVVQIGAGSTLGRGGMGAKVEAASLAARAGVTTVIASGVDGAALGQVLRGEDVGTVFPAVQGLSRRKRWIAFSTAPQGVVHVNKGAKQALVERQASLLAPGVVGVDGTFLAGSVVEIGCDGVVFARGVCARSSEDARAAMHGALKGKALVHRDDVVIIEGWSR